MSKKKKSSKPKPAPPQGFKIPNCIEIQDSGIHGSGLFATRDIEADEEIVEYLGEKITKAESYKRAVAQLERAEKGNEGAVYIFDLNKKYDIDGNFKWNPARFINHSCEPNCDAYNIKGRIYIYSTKRIKKGGELLYNYGYDIEHYKDHPCLCGSSNCVGYIVHKDQWKELKKRIRKDQKTEIISHKKSKLKK
ncbi:MAG: SET domain-containing protein-lysine N-methyltransferase [Verrucomicrobiota bacterium]